MVTTANAEACGQELALLEPTGTVLWLKNSFIWVGGLKCDEGRTFALIRHKPGEQMTRIAELGGPQFCFSQANDVAYAQGIDQPIAVSVDQTADAPNLSPASDTAMDDCKFEVARAKERIEAQGYSGVTAVAFGRDVDGDRAAEAMLACRRVNGTDQSELLLFRGNRDPETVAIEGVLAWDNPVLNSVPSGGWIAYPSFSYQRRLTLKSVLPGLPLYRIGPDGAVAITWVPWADWNESGSCRFYVAGNGYLAAASFGWTEAGERLSGIYQIGQDGWYRRFSGEIDTVSVAVSGDGGHVGWREQFKVEPPSPRYGKLRYTFRVESL